MSFENNLNKGFFNSLAEKSYIDKILAKSEVEEIKEIMQNEKPKRGDIIKLLYLLGGTEIKLVNLEDWDRYVLGKYFAWISDFTNTYQQYNDVAEHIEVIEQKSTEKINEKNKSIDDKLRYYVVTKEMKKMLQNIDKLNMHNTKFIIAIYFYLSRSTLSLGNTGFDTLSSTRFEYAYPTDTLRGVEEKKGLARIFGGK